MEIEHRWPRSQPHQCCSLGLSLLSDHLDSVPPAFIAVTGNIACPFLDHLLCTFLVSHILWLTLLMLTGG